MDNPAVRFCDSCQGSIPLGQPAMAYGGRTYCAGCWDRLRLQAPAPAVYVMPGAAAIRPGNGLGTAALVLGIITLALGWIPYLCFFLWPVSLVGIGLGVGGLFAGRARSLPRGTAIAGLILSILAGMTSGLMSGALLVGRFVGVQEDVKIKAASAQLKQFSSNLERYRLDMDRYPTTEEGLEALVRPPDNVALTAKWRGPYLSEVFIPKDPWRSDYIYRCPGEHNELTFDIMSPGPDGEEGTEDDIVNWATENY